MRQICCAYYDCAGANVNVAARGFERIRLGHYAVYCESASLDIPFASGAPSAQAASVGAFASRLVRMNHRRISMKLTVLAFLGVAVVVTLGGVPAFAHHAATATYLHGK